MQIVSYLPSALSAETNIILFDSIRPRSRTDVLPTPTPALTQLVHKRFELRNVIFSNIRFLALHLHNLLGGPRKRELYATMGYYTFSCLFNRLASLF